jgi:dCMP deaminase
MLKVQALTDPQRKWDLRFLKQAELVASYSKDPSTKVGAIIVNELRQVVGQGYNGFARGVDDDPARYENRPVKYKFVVHAELNAVIAAGHAARGGTIYVWPAFVLPPTCHDCAKAIIQSGIVAVVGLTPNVDAATAARWEESISVARTMYEEAGLEWRQVSP